MNGCVHHWVLQEPAGAVSEGTCKLCGATKGFRNVLEDVSITEVTRRRRMGATG